MTWESAMPWLLPLLVTVVIAIWQGWPALKRARAEVRAKAVEAEARANRADASESLSNAAAALVEPYRREVEHLRAEVATLRALLTAEQDARRAEYQNSAFVIGDLQIKLRAANEQIQELERVNTRLQSEVELLRRGEAAGEGKGT